MFLVFVPHGVFDYGSIAESQFVIFLNERLFGLGIALWRVFLGLEEILEFSSFVNLSQCAFGEHSALQLRRSHLVVALQHNVAHLHLVFLVDVHLKHHLVLARHVVTLNYVDVGVLVAFVVVVFLGQNFCSVHQVLRHAQALGHAQLCFQVFALAFLHAIVLHLADAWAQCEVDAEVDLGVDDAVGGDAHLREQSVFPIAFHGFRDFAAGHFYLLSHAEARKVDEHIVLIVGNSLHGQSSYLHLSGRAGVGDVGLVDEILRRCVAK